MLVFLASMLASTNPSPPTDEKAQGGMVPYQPPGAAASYYSPPAGQVQQYGMPPLQQSAGGASTIIVQGDDHKKNKFGKLGGNVSLSIVASSLCGSGWSDCSRCGWETLEERRSLSLEQTTRLAGVEYPVRQSHGLYARSHLRSLGFSSWHWSCVGHQPNVSVQPRHPSVCRECASLVWLL